MNWLKQVLCSWTHGGGHIKRDSQSRINWQCQKCGRWADPVPLKQEQRMTDLTEASLEAMLMKIRKNLDDTGDRIGLIPKYFIVRPSDLEALGLTVDEVTKMIKEKNV